MVGKLARLAEGAPWVRFLISHLYRSVACALAQNKYTLETSSPEFQELTNIFKRKDFKGRVRDPGLGDYNTANEHKIVRFALKRRQEWSIMHPWSITLSPQ